MPRQAQLLEFSRPATITCAVPWGSVPAPRCSRGFAYGTLPGHPERGEEAFLVRRHHGAAVTFTITAFSRPASALARAAGPVGRGIQRRITGRYLSAIQR
jgi:uncharacterized protein (UPF0548 family)